MSQIISLLGYVEDRFAHLEAQPLSQYAEGPALLWDPAVSPDEVLPLPPDISLIVVPFEAHADGRGFSIAAALRQLGYRGHLRARGHLIVDQFRAALASGFDDVEIDAAQAARAPERQWQAVTHAPGYRAQLFAADGAT